MEPAPCLENELGSIEPGKQADLVIPSQ